MHLFLLQLDQPLMCVYILTLCDKISIFKVHIFYWKRRFIMSNNQYMFVSQRNLREKIVIWSTIPFWDTKRKALTFQCVFLYIYLLKKISGSATVSTPFKWHHKRSNIYWVMEHAGTAGWIEEVCIMINYLLIDEQSKRN